MTMTAERAARSVVPQKPLPNADLTDLANGIRWADHALQRCQERNISPYEVVAALLWADRTEPHKDNVDCRIHYRGDLRIIFDTKRRRVVTVMTLNDNSIPRVALTPDNPNPPAAPAAQPVRTVMAQKFNSGPDALLDFMKGLNPGDTFTRADFLAKYRECGLSEASLTVALTVARGQGELQNSNDNPALTKGTWMIPKQPGVAPTPKPKAVPQPTFTPPPPQEEENVNGSKPNGNGSKPSAALAAVEVTPLPVTKLEPKAQPKHAAPGSEAHKAMTAKQAKRAVDDLMAQVVEIVEDAGATWSTFGGPDERTWKITWKQGS